MTSSEAPAVGSRRARAAATQAALKQAAQRAFDRQGYLNTKITDITAEAGRAAGSFYNHFSSKEQLLESLLSDVYALGDRVAAEHPTDHDLSDREVLRWHIAGFWDAFRRYRTVFVAIQQAAMVDAAFNARLLAINAEQQESLRDHLQWLVDRGHPLPGPPESVALAMSAMWLQFAHANSWYPQTELADDAAIDLLTDFTLGGLVGDRRDERDGGEPPDSVG